MLIYAIVLCTISYCSVLDGPYDTLSGCETALAPKLKTLGPNYPHPVSCMEKSIEVWRPAN